METDRAKKKYFKNDFTQKNTPFNFAFPLKKEVVDIQPIGVGKATLPPGMQSNGSTSPNSVCLFYTCEGSGSFTLEETTYYVKEHEFFVLPPGTISLLCSDVKTGWTHRYITFTGTISLDFLDFPTVFSLPEEITSRLYDPTEEERNPAYRLASDLYLIYAKMKQPKEETQDYVQNVINLINTSYREKLTVAEMAAEMGLDRSHLSRLFKSRMGISIQNYILHFRTTKAKQYLLSGYSVSDTALLCGFCDYTSFSRAFLRETGYRPTEYLKYFNQDSYSKPR